MNLQGARAIADPARSDLYDKMGDCERFKQDFRTWITDSKLNHIAHLDDHQHVTLCAGTAQAFDHFYIKHHMRRFRWLRGEFMYHRAVLKQGFEYKLLDDGDLERGDAVIISVPFSDLGRKHSITDDLLAHCDRLGIPVLIDMAYLPVSRNVQLDLSHACIDAVAFSISKFYPGAENLRVGVRFQRENHDDGIDVFNSVGMNNRVDIALAHDIIRSHSIDSSWQRYGKAYEKVIADMGLARTDCLMFGLDMQGRYPVLNRGNTWTRICVSDLVAEQASPS